MTHADNTRHLQRAAAARHDTAVDRARAAIEELERSGQPLTFTSVARTARVSRGWLYSQSDLRDAITALRRSQPTNTLAPIPAAQRATSESLRQRLDSAREEIAGLRVENAALRDQLARSLGEQRARR